MKKIKYLIFSFFAILLFFIGLISASAKSQSMNINMNGSSWNGNLWFGDGRNITLRIMSTEVIPDITEIPSYGYVKFCSYQPITAWYSGNITYAKTIDFVDTGIKCKAPSWTWNGTLRYATFNIPKWNCSVNGTNCYYDNNIVFYQENSSDYYLMSSGFTDEPIQIDYASGTIISQNDTQINQNNTIINQNTQINESINNTNNTMKDDNVDSAENTINNAKNSIANNGVITQLVTLPVTLFQKILTSVNSSCSTYSLGSLYGTEILLPCINISNYIGASLWSVIDVLISGLFVWSISKKMINAFNNFSTMKEGDVLSD